MVEGWWKRGGTRGVVYDGGVGGDEADGWRAGEARWRIGWWVEVGGGHGRAGGTAVGVKGNTHLRSEAGQVVEQVNR